MTEEGLDTGDKVLAKSIAFKIIHAMRQRRLRGTLEEVERRQGRCPDEENPGGGFAGALGALIPVA